MHAALTTDGRSRILGDGTVMPLLGLGVWQVPEGRECVRAVRWALEAGYRHIDTAQAYGNEASVGRALRESGLARDEVFLTTKFHPRHSDALREIAYSVDRLGVDYVDLYLVHWPEGGATWAWPEMEHARERSYTRSIGVSNFGAGELDELMAVAGSPPVVDQVQFSPFAHREGLARACARHAPDRSNARAGGPAESKGEHVSETALVATYVDAKNQVLSASNGVEYAYRSTGSVSDAAPLVTLQHFRGNLDNWDPALIDALARGRQVITFDNRGVAASTGTTPSTITQMALDAIDFIDSLEVQQVDLLGFSIGSFVAQEVALVRPSIVRKLVLASAAPKGASGMHGWAADVIAAVGKPDTPPEDYLSVFFTSSEASRAAGQAVLSRIFGARTVDRDAATNWQTRLAQYDAVCTWGQPNHSLLERVSAIDKPVFVANGDSDPMILPRYSYLLAGLIPEARLKLYPDAAHGFLFQHHAEFAADVDAFLAGT